MEFLSNYGLFLAQAVTIVVAIVAVLIAMVALGTKGKSEKGQLDLINLTDELEEAADSFRGTILSKDELKKRAKAKKKQAKEDKSSPSEDALSNLFVIDFNGSMAANEVEGLRR